MNNAQNNSTMTTIDLTLCKAPSSCKAMTTATAGIGRVRTRRAAHNWANGIYFPADGHTCKVDPTKRAAR